MTEERLSWTELIRKYRDDPAYKNTKDFKSRTCSIYNRNPAKNAEIDFCPCGRLLRRHSFDGSSLEAEALRKGAASYKPPPEFLDYLTHSRPVPINVFGQLNVQGCKFVRIDSQHQLHNIFELLHKDCGKKPVLILSVYGGAKYFTMTERLEKEIIRGIIEAAIMADAWILTTGLNSGVSKLVGEGIFNYRLLREYSDKVKCIGLTMWGAITEETRLELKKNTQDPPNDFCRPQLPSTMKEDKETIERNHTHCILFDSGRLHEYLSDGHRSEFVQIACNDQNQKCYAVTILVEGGLGSLEVVLNDIGKKRPVVIIQGSGRLADSLATLIDLTSNADGPQQWNLTDQEIVNAIERFFFNNVPASISSSVNQIKRILNEKHRYLLHVFSLERDKNVAEIIFKAIFTATNKMNKDENNTTEKNEIEEEKTRRNDENKLIDLALRWNYFDGVLPILQARQGEKLKLQEYLIEEDLRMQKELFHKSLQYNRPNFVEYFLSAGFDPTTLANDEGPHSFLLKLYQNSYEHLALNHKKYLERFLGKTAPKTEKNLDEILNKFVGAFFQPIYSPTGSNRVAMDINNHVCICCDWRYDHDQFFEPTANPLNKSNPNELTNSYSKAEFIRDLFFWAIFLDMPEMGKVLLLQIRSRVCAALTASAIFKRYAALSPTIDLREKYQSQSLEFETYAAMSINKCYEFNELQACELLLRQIPLFGNVTCMQVAIASESRKLLETACFDQALNQVWYNKLSVVNHLTGAKLAQVPAVFSLGLLAPAIITYRDPETESLKQSADEKLSPEGIKYYIDRSFAQQSEFRKYWKKFLYFHESPMVKMSYHFLSYIWFLLVFSYMMLYHLDPRNTFVIPHWTEIYVIITVSTMFCEEVRKLYHEYSTFMIERWGSTGSTVMTFLSNVFYILPYFFFYLGLGFRYGSSDEAILSTARIIWALDLELWYLRSMKFVIALKFLGPKLFMLKNMLRDLFAFVYMIFIAITAYGVVSRSLILYNQVPFTGRGIFSEIFYEPYWFIYGDVEDKQLLDSIIQNNTNMEEAEATATHVLLAFHMLFINILLLNLLIAVFADTIGKVQENTEFYWRYQRYSFVREYFERVPFAYPPLIFFSHLLLICVAIRNLCCGKCCNNRVTDENHVSYLSRLTPIFKMIPMNKTVQDEKWDSFENAATYSCARAVLEKNKQNFNLDDNKARRFTTTVDSNKTFLTTTQNQTVSDVKEELMSAVHTLHENQKELEQNTTRIESRLEKINQSIGWMMEAMERVKMNNPKHPKPSLEIPLPVQDQSLRHRVTTTSNNANQ